MLAPKRELRERKHVAFMDGHRGFLAKIAVDDDENFVGANRRIAAKSIVGDDNVSFAFA